ncbi:serine/threonine-protein kinase [Streptomyces jeddahensis]|uniref:serine/threonine-protein kinase n=1 Tax=Streptomyces jeddahensis TaxID=1716141 RepID=UPI00098FFE67|nr:serine/threonine-protein kinase [Streptomyces jeddahensis]
MEKLGPGDPQAIGAYRLLARLGAGGMGQVYLARSDRGRTVAVKLVRRELAEQEEFRSRFRLEVQAARRVGGQWTAPVLDADTEAAIPWVATGYVAGPSLGAVVSRDHGALPERSVRILAAGLAHALKDIHAAGLIHRDLKPSNVLVTIDGPRVIDFGIARALETVTDGGLTRTGALVGSPGFMAPEQVRGDRITPACDVFCLGSVLAYAATGQLPFGTANSGVHALMFRIAQEEPDLDRLPERLTDLVRDCLRKDPAARPSLDDILDRTGAQDTVGDGRARDPWLPSALVARLGRHAVRLLETENPEGAGAGAAAAAGPAGPARPAGVPQGDAAGTPGADPAGAWRYGSAAASGATAAAAAAQGGDTTAAPGAGPAAAHPAGHDGAPAAVPGPRPAEALGAAPAGTQGPTPAGGHGSGPAGAQGSAPAGSAPAGPQHSGAGDAQRPGPAGPHGAAGEQGAAPPEAQGPAPAGPQGTVPPGGYGTGPAAAPQGTSPAAPQGTSVAAGAQNGVPTAPQGPTPQAVPGAGTAGPHGPHGAGPARPGAPWPPEAQAGGSGPAVHANEPPYGPDGPGGQGGTPPPPGSPGQPPVDHLPTQISGPPPVPAPRPSGQPGAPGYGYPQGHSQPHPSAYGYPQPGGYGPSVPPYGPGGVPSTYEPYEPGGMAPTPPYGPGSAPSVYGTVVGGPGSGHEPPPRSRRSTIALIAAALVVAVGAGGSVYAVMKGDGEPLAGGDAKPSASSSGPAEPGSQTPGASGTPSGSSGTPQTSPTASVGGEVPEKYLGTWTGGIDNDAGHNTRRLVIQQGEVGDTVLSLTADGPAEGGGTYHCVFQAKLASAPSGEGPLRIGPSTVTAGEPASSCTPGAATTLTILPDGRLRRVNTETGEQLTYTKAG